MKMGDRDGLPICRVCLKSTMECVDFETPLEENNSISHRECFNLSTQLNALEDDELPKNLCCACSDELKLVFQFIRKARASDKLLRDKINCTKEEDNKPLEEDLFDASQYENDIPIKDEIVIFEIEENYSIPKDREENEDNEENEENQENQEDEEEEDELESQELESDEQYEDEPQCIVKTETNTNQKLPRKSKKLLLCNICGKTCSQKSSLESHLLKHKGERPFKCEKCEKSYFTKNGLQMHMIIHTGNGVDRKFACDVCDKAFATAQRLRVHNLMHTGEKDYKCTMCPKRFATQFRLRNHIRIHTGERPYECKVCGLKFGQNNALKCHMRIHTGERPYECKICGKCFNQNTILKTHMTLHTGKTVQCPNCDKKFSRPSYLILHQREHTGEKPYVCHKCPNRYKQKSHLDRHLDTHLGIKHTCEQCGKEYSKKSSLKIHMFTHIKEKPFHCESCSISFTRRDKFRNHLKKIHDQDLVNNEVTDVITCDEIKEETQKTYMTLNSGREIVQTILVRKSK